MRIVGNFGIRNNNYLMFNFNFFKYEKKLLAM